VSETVLAHLGPDVQVGIYVEQPYAVWEAAGPPELSSRILRRLQQAVRHPAAVDRQRPRAAEPSLDGQPAEWEVVPLTLADQAAKLRAVRAYRSQLRGFGPGFITQIMLYARADGGEPIGWAN
jgi:LmbE family N-acetylglucosaminyl deacetylase